MTRRLYQLKVTLGRVQPPVWRRLLVPSGYTLDRLHRCVQYAMGWQNCHLHSFEISGVQYGEPDPDDELEMRDEMDSRLDAIAAKGTNLLYVYDFGAWWEHDVVVEDVLAADPGERYPICLAGGRACPPEDVGGPDGYAELLEAIADPHHREHESTKEWIGRDFDPERFDPGLATTLLRRLA